MKFKLLFVLTVRFVNSEAMFFDHFSSEDRNRIGIGIKKLREDAFLSDQEYHEIENDLSDSDAVKALKISALSWKLNRLKNKFLIDNEYTDKMLTMEREDCCYFTIPFMMCCKLPLRCCGQDFSTLYEKKAIYKRAQFNVIRATAFVEQDIKR